MASLWCGREQKGKGILMMDNTTCGTAIADPDRVFYTASPFARNSLLYLQEMGRGKTLPAHTSEQGNMQAWLFFVVRKGSGSFSYRGKKYDLREGSCAFIDCGEPYIYSMDTDDWEICWVCFSGLPVMPVYDKYCERGGRPVFIQEDLTGVRRIWSNLMDIAKVSDSLTDMKINAYLSDLLAFVMDEAHQPEKREGDTQRVTVGAVREYIDQNYASSIDLDDLAERFGIDKGYLSKSFKKQTGQSIIEYTRVVRINKAKELLRFTDQTLDEIGKAVGITPGRYLSEVFKAVEGVVPSDYRKQWKLSSRVL